MQPLDAAPKSQLVSAAVALVLGVLGPFNYDETAIGIVRMRLLLISIK